MKVKGRKIVDWTLNFVVAAAALMVVMILIAPRLGFQVHPVLSGSMEPSLKVGGLILTRVVPLEQVAKGDVITYKYEDQRITHRVISVLSKNGKVAFQTKGDANESADPYTVTLKGKKVPKVVYYVPYFGFLAAFMNNKSNFVLAIGVTSAILLALYCRDIRRDVRTRRHKNRRVVSRTGEGG